MHLGAREKIVDQGRRVVLHHQRGRVSRFGPSEQLDHIREKGCIGERMFITVHTIDRMCNIQRLITRALCRGHQTERFTGLYHPLPLFPVTHYIALNIARLVVIPVAPKIRVGIVIRLKVSITKDAARRHKRTLPNRLPCFDKVTIRQIIVRSRLNIETGGYAVGRISNQ